MQLAVSYDKHGNITTLFDPSTLRGETVTSEYVPAAGENHHLIELPKQFEGKSVMELGPKLRVSTSGAKPVLEAKP